MFQSFKVSKFQHFIVLFFCLLALANCKIKYSFTGASISPDIKTVSIQYFPNYAPIVQPTLSQVFTEKMKDKFASQTNLSLVKSNGDLSFEGSITGYSTQPIAIQGNETAAMNRLTITVNVKFTNAKNEKQNFEKPFSFYSDYSSTKSLASVESGLIKDITDRLVDDIFNASVSNW